MTVLMARREADLLLAVDGGNSKTDLVLLTVDGTPLAAVRGPGSSAADLGVDGSMELLDVLYRRLLDQAPGRVDGNRPRLAMLALAGADYPDEEAALAAAAGIRGWAGRTVVRNDAFAMLRAGTDRGWGVAVVCGAGVNCVGVAPGGAVVRFPALGAISGDWGGGHDLGLAALASAVRGEDGRDEPTLLTDAVPAYFGLPTAAAVTEAIHRRQLPESRLVELPPVVYATAEAGDPVAGELIDRLADELVAFVRSTLVQLDLVDADPDVVLGGGLLRAGPDRLHVRIRDGILVKAPRARIVPLTEAPVVGAALLALDEIAAGDAAVTKFRAAYAAGSAAVREVRAS